MALPPRSGVTGLPEHILREAVRFTTYTDGMRRTAAPLRAGFTLIELLIVLAIVALLAAILLPVIANSREKARASACFSNYRQIGAAIHMYATDSEGDTPPDGGSFSGLMEDCRPYLKETAVFVCPDDFDREREKRPGTYRMPSLYQGLTLNCGWPDPYAAVAPGAVPPEAEPSTAVLLYEAEQDFAQSPITPTYRHNGGAQILYFDGHAKWIAGHGAKDDDD